MLRDLSFPVDFCGQDRMAVTPNDNHTARRNTDHGYKMTDDEHMTEGCRRP
jgi:hypothetical protein